MTALKAGTRILTALTLAAATLACGDRHPLQPEPDLQASYEAAPVKKQLKNRPLHGNTKGQVVGQVFPAPAGRCPVHLPVLFLYTGEGRATHLGNFQVDGSECVFMDPSNPINMASGEGRFTWTTANGDELHVAYDATTLSFQGPGSPWLTWRAPIYVTGGTGRFQNAQITDVVWEGGANMATFETYSSFDGYLAYDASDRGKKN
jgi:hypothetical protein